MKKTLKQQIITNHKKIYLKVSIVKAASKILDYEVFKRDKEKLLKNSSKKSKKSAQITAKKISQKHKILKKPKERFLVNEEDLETIVYDPEEQEDLFMGESILAAANKVLDFDEFKKQQAKAINNYNQNLLENVETIMLMILTQTMSKITKI